MSESVCQRKWEFVTEQIMPKSLSELWWAEINKKFRESGREAHNMTYLQSKFDEMQHFSINLSNVNAFILALFFQHFEYDTKDPEFYSRNLDGFEKLATEANLMKDGVLYEQVKRLLETSLAPCTEEHKTEGEYGQQDIHYFLDVDMVWLGREPEVFKQYIEKAEMEYSYLEPAAYKRLMQRVLQSFLLIPNIYATKIFRDKYEAQARSNIEHELKRLAG